LRLPIRLKGAIMAIAFDNAAVSQTTTLRTTAGLLLTATANAVLLVYTNVSNDQSTSAVNVGANNLTRLGSVTFLGTARRAELWGLTAPPSGVLTISCTMAGAGLEIGMAAVTYVGHLTSATPFGGVTSNSGSATAQTSLVISSTTTNLAVFGFMLDSFADGTAGAGLTTRLKLQAWQGFVIADAPGALSLTGSATAAAAASWGNLGINLIASAGSAWKFSLAQMSVGR
jgi:hypothetical protein